MTAVPAGLVPFDDDGNLRVVVETPRNATVKYKYEPKDGLFTISRALPLGVA